MSSTLAYQDGVSRRWSELPRGSRFSRAHRGAAATQRFACLDEMAPAIAGELELIQVGPGAGGSLASVPIDGGEVQLGRYAANTLTRGTAAATRVSVLIPLRARTPGLWEGVPSDPGTLLLYAPGAQQFAYDGEGACWARISVGAEHLERAFFAATGRELELPDAGFRRLCLETESIVRLKQSLCGLPTSVDAGAAPRLPSLRYRGEQLLGELCRALESAGDEPTRATRGIDPRRIVRAVDEHLEPEFPERVYLADLAAAAEASERTVEYAFRRLLALTPMHYVKLRRLVRVQRVLRDSPPGSTTVTRVALDWGFDHLSQFARDYRGVYGETPSATLRQTGLGPRPHLVSGHHQSPEGTVTY